jgi:HEPN domain-containing protein
MADEHDLALELVGLAEDDRIAAAALLGVAAVSDAIVGFHAQQAVEKALKAVLASVRVEFPFTHNIAMLMQLCEDAGVQPPPTLVEADLLTPYGVMLRYGARSPGTLERKTALSLAGEAVAWARGLVQN